MEETTMGVKQVLAKSDTRFVILSHLTLPEVQSLRKVSKECKTAADNYKDFLVQQINLKDDMQVLVVGLKSEKGKLLNEKIGKIDSEKIGKGRLAIRLATNWISGESEVLRIKLKNIHPFFHQLNYNYKDKFSCPLPLVSYSTTSNIRESHGRLLHQVLAFAKWFVLEADGENFEGDINDYMGLPLSHPLNIDLSQRMFDYWQEPPFRCSRSRETFGTALDYVVGLTMFNNDDDLEEGSRRWARYDQIWPADGGEGQYMLRNFFHCMKSWKEERVTGGFWVTDVYKTGTVMVHLSDLNDPESFSTVYLVKGHNKTIGELVQRSERTRIGFCRATILPLYDFWTYDGIVIPGRYKATDLGGAAFEDKLRLHVQKAIYTQNVSWRGPAAEAGLWNFEVSPSPVPRLSVNEGNYYVVDWQDDTDGNNVSLGQASSPISSTEEEIEIARRIAKRAVELGGTREVGATEDVQRPDLSAMTIRRLGHSREENPNGLCTLLDSRVEREPIHFFHFDVADEMDIPAYTLTDVLQAILAAMEEAAPLPLVEFIMIDDRSLLQALDNIMMQAFEDVGLIAPEIEYYGRGT